MIGLIVIVVAIAAGQRWRRSNYLTIRPLAGLGNRLRVLLGHKRLNKPLKVYWPNERDCPGEFLDVFLPFPGVEFVDWGEWGNYDYRGVENFEQISLQHGLPIDDNEKYRLFKSLRLRPELQEIVEDVLTKHDLWNGVSLHIRRTDHIKHRTYGHIKRETEKNDYSPDSIFTSYVDSLPSNTPIFLATDNSETQDKFLQAYPGRVYFYTGIKGDSRHDKRLTTLAHAAIDIYVCASTKYFKGSKYSSFTDTILTLRGDDFSSHDN
jgi:hypothetical protein